VFRPGLLLSGTPPLADKFFWALDFPHPDHLSNYMAELAELVAPLSEETRRKVLGDNVKQGYHLS
jgi:hypothetical protein